MIPIVLLKKILCYQFFASVEVSNMARCLSKTNELRCIDSIGCRARNITVYKWKIDDCEIKVVTFIINFGRNNSIRS